MRAGNVLHFHQVGHKISALVRGTRQERFTQEIDISDPMGLVGSCTCPAERNCKHVVAALIAYADASGLGAPETGSATGNATGAATGRFAEVADRAATVSDTVLNPQVKQWLNGVKSASSTAVRATEPPKPTTEFPTQTLLFLFSDRLPHAKERSLYVSVVVANILANGAWGVVKPLKRSALQTKSFPKSVSESESALVLAADRNFGWASNSTSVSFMLSGFDSDSYLQRFLATQKCRWLAPQGTRLRAGAGRVPAFRWQATESSVQVMNVSTDPESIILPTWPMRYIDTTSGEVGELESELSLEALHRICAAPDVAPIAAHTVRAELMQVFPDRPDLWPRDFGEPEIIQIRPTPFLTFLPVKAREMSRSWRDLNGSEFRFYVMSVDFDYLGQRVNHRDEPVPLPLVRDGRAVVVSRDLEEEARRIRQLQARGAREIAKEFPSLILPSRHAQDFAAEFIYPETTDQASLESTMRFIEDARDDLEASGWEIEAPEELRVVRPDDDWYIDLGKSVNNWFELSLGVEVDGQRIDLLPVLIQAIRQFWSPGSAEVAEDAVLYYRLPDGRHVEFPAQRLEPLVRTLRELFGEDRALAGQLRVALPHLTDLLELENYATKGFVWSDPDGIRAIGQRLRQADSVREVEPPEALVGVLRPYQAQGLSWLQFIREFNFGAILADDMGLGKTIQTIAHLLVEKQEGRLDRPTLIVAPTSTLPNWSAELERFSPSLSVLVAQGLDRRQALERIGETDIVLTTYPLLSRDHTQLCAHQYHLLVLDEAQNIKNPKTAMWHAARAIQARHRLCLTGTPMENHLGELWSLFEFLMPGFLGTSESFRRRFRTPIETFRSPEATERLTRTVRPFMLRRTKEAVASELPPKTELVERVDLAGPQRDLYESLRLAMSKRVRDEIASRGLRRSQIVVLDALLKLRQACCDPRLVKSPTARTVKGSAKLERFLEMALELKAEGRRALVFSQFTSMLALIEERLQHHGIDYVLLTGSTTDRATPVQRFQNGEVTLFLISLKAGGTGLNLTAADTVIHYDPWWNPAVERQATDRAHRIGQTKPVFVYKLVARDTVEERILELQNRKSDLADALLSGNSDAKLTFTQEDVEWFFGT